MLLRCSNTNCGTALELHERTCFCPKCNELLELVVESSPFAPSDLKRIWNERRCSNSSTDFSGVWRYREFLPDYPAECIVTLGEGNVPLVRGHKSADYAGLIDLQFKHLGWNPTACFKDLGMTVGITEAKFVGATTVACASTGNTSGSLAAYAARAGLTARVYLPAGRVSLNKLAQSLDYGAEVVEIQGSFDEALERLLKNDPKDAYFLNSINPFRIEGQKTVMFELMQQLDWTPPDFIVVPGGNLGNSAAFGKALKELKTFGFIERVPKIIVVQAKGANPFTRVWKEGGQLIATEQPETEATAIRIGNPRSWKKSLQGVVFSGGCVVDVTDDEIETAKKVIGRDGIGCEPASATTLAALRNLRLNGTIARDAQVVAILTGHVLKDTEYIIRKSRRASDLKYT